MSGPMAWSSAVSWFELPALLALGFAWWLARRRPRQRMAALFVGLVYAVWQLVIYPEHLTLATALLVLPYLMLQASIGSYLLVSAIRFLAHHPTWWAPVPIRLSSRSRQARNRRALALALDDDGWQR